MKKRKVSGDYTFKTCVVYPRWWIRSLDEYNPALDMMFRMVRLDHRFQAEGQWKCLFCETNVDEWSRSEIAGHLWKMRKQIIEAKRAKT